MWQLDSIWLLRFTSKAWHEPRKERSIEKVAVVYLRTMTSRLASLLTDGQGTVVVHHTKAQQQLSRHRNATQGPPTCRFWSEQRCPQPNRDRSTKASAKLYMQHMHIRFDWTGHARTTDVRDVLRECVFTSMIHIYILIGLIQWEMQVKTIPVHSCARWK